MRYLQPSKCLPLIPDELIAEYAVAQHYLLATEWELSELDPNEWDCSQPMLVMRENVTLAWSGIGAILRAYSDFSSQPPGDTELENALKHSRPGVVLATAKT